MPRPQKIYFPSILFQKIPRESVPPKLGSKPRERQAWASEKTVSNIGSIDVENSLSECMTACTSHKEQPWQTEANQSLQEIFLPEYKMFKALNIYTHERFRKLRENLKIEFLKSLRKYSKEKKNQLSNQEIKMGFFFRKGKIIIIKFEWS